MQGVTPFFWFDGNAEEAVNFYLSVFPNSKLTATTRSGDSGPGPKNAILTMSFELDGRKFVALNGGPKYKINEAISFVVECDTQAEIDHFWDKLPAGGGQHIQCGWLRDRFGVTWQIVPVALWKMMQDPDKGKVERVLQALWAMEKLDLAGLEKAYRS